MARLHVNSNMRVINAVLVYPLKSSVSLSVPVKNNVAAHTVKAIIGRTEKPIKLINSDDITIETQGGLEKNIRF